jgi:ribosomal protein S27AE
MESKKLLSFEEVRTQVANQAALNNPDMTVELAGLRITPELNIEIPKAGTFSMTPFAKKQMGSMMGVQWDRWFDPKLVDHTVVQDELQRRFSKTQFTKKLRTTGFRSGAPGVKGCDGYLRGVLGPTYYPIDDERIFSRLENKFGHRVEGLKFMANHLSRNSHWGNGHCQHYTIVGERMNMGPIDRDHADDRVRNIYRIAEAEGMLPEDDFIYSGFHMRNSEVGFTAITIDEFTFRLVCLNGMMIKTGAKHLMYRQHRPIEDKELDKQFDDVFAKIPVRWEQTRQTLAGLQGSDVSEPERILTEELKKLGASKKFAEATVKAFEEEPLKTRYGMLQAITRAAQGIEDMDKRYEMELLAGQFMQRAARS